MTAPAPAAPELRRLIALAELHPERRPGAARAARSAARADLIPDTWVTGTPVEPVEFAPPVTVEAALAAKLERHNQGLDPDDDERRANLAQVRAVYRRGSTQYETEGKSGVTRDMWAHARVNAFLSSLAAGIPAPLDADLVPKALRDGVA